MKRLSLLLCGFLFAASLYAQNRGVDGNLVWNISGGTLSITGVGDMTDYAMAKAPWYAARANVTKVVVSNTVTSIGQYAFYGFRKLAEATISTQATSIGDCAFAYCFALTTVTLPDRINSIGDNAFVGCGLTAVYVHNTTPPTLAGNGIFPKKKARLVVPAGSEQAYGAAWKEYFNKVVSSGETAGNKVEEAPATAGKVNIPKKTLTVFNDIPTKEEKKALLAQYVGKEFKDLTDYPVFKNLRYPNFSEKIIRYFIDNGQIFVSYISTADEKYKALDFLLFEADDLPPNIHVSMEGLIFRDKKAMNNYIIAAKEVYNKWLPAQKAWTIDASGKFMEVDTKGLEYWLDYP